MTDEADDLKVVIQTPYMRAEPVAWRFVDLTNVKQSDLPGTPHVESRFTLVFDGDLRKLGINPLAVMTPFGKPRAAFVGDALAEIDKLSEELERANG